MGLYHLHSLLHSFILLFLHIAWTEDAGGLQSIGLQSQTRLERLSTHAHISTILHSVLCSKRLNSMNHSHTSLASGLQLSSGNGKPQWRMQELRRGHPEIYSPCSLPDGSLGGPSKSHISSWVASSHISLYLGSENHSLFLLFQT